MGLQGRWNAAVLETIDQREIVVGVRCLAHTIQHVVQNGIKNAVPKVTTLIDLCRTVAKALRVQSTKYELKKFNLFTVCPRLDATTRWSSTYDMVC